VTRRLLYFITEDWYFVLHWLPLAAAARQAGYDVTVLTRVRDHGKIIRDAGLRLLPIELERRSVHPLRELRLTFRLARAYRSTAPDIVHHIALKPAVEGTLAARLAGVPCIVNSVVGLGWVFVGQSVAPRVLRRLLKTTARWVFRRSIMTVPNSDDRNYFQRLGVDARLIRGPGVDLREYTVSPEPTEGAPIVLLAARMLWDKGIAEFVEAARLVRESGVPARFVLVGTPDASNPSSVPETRLAQWHDEGKVEWWGWRDDMPAVIAQSSIVCLPSYREGLPRIVMEAGACARPVVAADAPGCREVVRHDENGFLVPVQDAQALAGALRKLLTDPALRARLGTRGRELAQTQFAKEIAIRDTIALYAQCAGSANQ